MRLVPGLAVTVLPAFALFIWHASGYGLWLIDDAGISYSYARNMVAGHGLVPQPGADPVEGYSNPLWVFLVALFYALQAFSVPVAPKVLGGFLVLSAFVMIGLAVRRIVPDRDWPIVAGASLLLSASNPGFVIWCVSGLENPLLVCLAAGLLLLCLAAIQDKVLQLHGVSAGAGAVAAGLALTRPDAVLYVVVYPLALLLSQRPFRFRPLVKPVLLYAVALLAPLAAYLSFRRAYFEDWLPNTFYAKPGTSIDGLRDLVHMWGPGAASFSELSAAIVPSFPLLLPIAVFAAAARMVHSSDRQEARGMCIVGMFVAVAIAAYLLLPQDWMGEYRYATVVFPFGYVLLMLLFQQLVAGQGLVVARRALLVTAGAAVLVSSAPAFAQRAELFAQAPPAPLEFVARASWRYNELAKVLARPDATLLLPDLGGTLMYSRVRVFDVAGLCDKGVARLYYENRTPAEFAKYVLRTIKPDFVHVHLFWAHRSGLLRDPEFQLSYVSLGSGDFVRRSSLPDSMDDAGIRAIYGQLGQPPEFSQLEAFPLLVAR
jgi:hypothetical protein